MSKSKHLPDKSDKIPSRQEPQIEAEKSEKQIAVGEVFSKIFGISAFSGPLPPPELLEHYNKIIPDGADRLLRLVELQSGHRRTSETKSLDASISITKRGQFLAFLLSLAGFSTAVLCAYLGQPVPSTVIGGGTLIGLASLFIKGYTHKRFEEKDEDVKEQSANVAP